MRKNKLSALVLSLAMAFALIAPASAYDASRPGAAQTLSGGAAESYYIDPSGTLWAWGDNLSGQLGNGESGFVQYFDPLISASPIQISISEQTSQEPTREAAPTNDSLTADGQPQNPTVYKINDSNYFKIRDLAAILNGTEKQFSVGYDGALQSVTAATGEAYQLTGTELLCGLDCGKRCVHRDRQTLF